MASIIDNWGLRYPGVKRVEHVYFYGADVSTPETRRAWLDQAYSLGRDFTASSASPGSARAD
jgi:putative NADPH-quinone reductase